MAQRAFDLTKIPHTRLVHKGVPVCEASLPLGRGNFKLVWRRVSLASDIIEVNGEAKANPIVHHNYNVIRGAKVSLAIARKLVITEFERVWNL